MDPSDVSVLRRSMFDVVLQVYGIDGDSARAHALRELLLDGCVTPPSRPQTPLMLLPPTPVIPDRICSLDGDLTLVSTGGSTSPHHEHQQGHHQQRYRRRALLPPILRLPHEILQEIMSFEFVPKLWLWEVHSVCRRFYTIVAPMIGRYQLWLHSVQHRTTTTTPPTNNNNNNADSESNDDDADDDVGPHLSGVGAAPCVRYACPKQYNVTVALMVCMHCGYNGLVATSPSTCQAWCVWCKDLRCCEMRKLLWTAS
eukprot:PhM_4_TR875/c0_g1_i1/m.52543